MRQLLQTSFLSLVIASLAACGGSSDSPKAASSAPSSSPASSVAPSSIMASSLMASSVAPSSIAPSSSAASSLMAGSEATTNSQVMSKGIEIAELTNCGVNISQGAKTYSMIADYDAASSNQSFSSLSGWNHITASAPWNSLMQAPSAYAFSNSAKADASCNNVDSLQLVLVKKIANWENQHGNGFEHSSLINNGITFGDVQSITLDLKINSMHTHIPSVASLKTTYASYVSAAVVDALDSGKVNLDITFYEKNSATKDYRAKVIMEIDQASMSDKWLRVTIPASALSYYLEDNYNRTNKTQLDLASVVIKGALVTAETKAGIVLRNNIATWSDATPETFKEVDVTFKKIEINVK
jgi:hypothetical protein